MRLHELIRRVFDADITYAKAIEALARLNLPEEIYEEYDALFLKHLGNDEPLMHMEIGPLKSIPNELYFELLTLTLKKMRNDEDMSEICNWMHETYSIDGNLMEYFLNEALHIVRMNDISSEEFEMIGEAYVQAKMAAGNKNVVARIAAEAVDIDGTVPLITEKPKRKRKTKDVGK